MKWAIQIFIGIVLISFLFSGCEKQEIAETGPLRICIDTGFHSRSDSVPASDVKNGAKFLTQMVASHLDMDVGDIELEIIPKGGTERKTALTRIRTEIMSGEGPDVFLCSTVDTSAYGSSETVLFPFPERAMADGLFLPLDYYLEKAEYMEPNKMLPAAMEAGKTENGQMILPISFTMWMTAYKAEDAQLPAAGTTFADVVASDDPLLQSTMVYTGRYDENYLWCSFPYLFTEIADYQKGELAIKEEDLYRTIKSVADIQAQGTVELPSHFSAQLIFNTYNIQYGGEDFRQGISGSTEQVMLPLYNIDGGATALICSFGAVNANTRRPKSAFLVLDYFLSPYMHRNSELYAFFCEDALPVHTEMGSTRDAVKTNGVTVEPYRVKNCTPLDSEAFTAYSDAREQISYARFNTVLDQELMKFATFSSGSIVADNEEALRKNVSDTYTKMQRLLDES